MRQSDLERIWERDILPVISVQAVTDHPPTTVFLGGQPAAGKTRAQKTMTCLCGELLLPIVGDDFRRFHPDYESLIRTSPLSMPHETAQAAGYWTGRAVEYADAPVRLRARGKERSAVVRLHRLIHRCLD